MKGRYHIIERRSADALAPNTAILHPSSHDGRSPSPFYNEQIEWMVVLHASSYTMEEDGYFTCKL